MAKGLKIDIDGTWGIMSDEMNLILGKWTTKKRKKGDEKVEVKTLKSRTYHTDFENLFKTYMENKIKASEPQLTNFKEVIKKEQEIKELIKEILKEHQKAIKEIKKDLDEIYETQ